MSSPMRRLCFLLVSLVVVMALLVLPAASTMTDEERKVVKVAAGCTRECHSLCAVLPKSEDPLCDIRCESIPVIFNGTVRDPATLHPQAASTAVQEIQMCSTGCSLRCIPEGASSSSSCRDKCADTFRPFSPAIANLGQTMATDVFAGANPQHAPRKVEFKFKACGDACMGKCVAWASKGGGGNKDCARSCAQACGFYEGAAIVLQYAMPPATAPSIAAVGGDTVASTFKACIGHCSANDEKCFNKCSYAGYIVSKAKAYMKLATGALGLPA